ncbi:MULTISPECIES: 7-cyano-7-deazaguanine synthase QueC [Thermus]|uniref:7-cyano-7-deazaguanine synthase n=4 Tax=Thermus TaxID=270 RepID=A0A348XNC0_THESC|nr:MULTISPECIES: 7-cyano-7-deazaguanine synthase QueC [Thermus]ADW21079.1 archaeosine biosynthesis protein QueC [Thermus scotoductus SA-01]QWK23067.1 MAG: 7-cyano-7-deazaguanine synthase QueC [Thermus antranikianii]RTH04519.1 7-cyano-7-deazaguanine synthase QueC [Thermus scotoductus]RTH15014.1 7-cyano-7-deazaguanine synthase QueC [Thermus scotoductus]RTH27559.1 7-cyano-7-deazaguanine synthase QueC [Thermus scotoductus]
MKRLVMLSGGLDSSVLLYKLKKQDGLEGLAAVYLDLGTPPTQKEWRAAEKVASRLGVAIYRNRVPHFELGDRLFSPPELAFPGRESIQAGWTDPCTMTPITGSLAAKMGVEEVYLGVIKDDFASHPRLEAYLALVKKFLEFNQVRLKMPLSGLTKQEVVALGHELGVPLEETWSCVASGEAPCGACNPCIAREEAFALADAKALAR